jgi:hypothetical protein
VIVVGLRFAVDKVFKTDESITRPPQRHAI